MNSGAFYQPRHFEWREVTCKCGCGMMPTNELLSALDDMRDALGFPLIVNSCARCPDYNRKVGGAQKSYHMRGLACDLQVWHLSGGELFQVLEYAVQHFDGIGVYDTFVHVDLRRLKLAPSVAWIGVHASA